MSSTGPSDKNAVRVVNQNSCGSGSICGWYQGGTLVLTNAHVAGTRVGREVGIDIQTPDGGRVRKAGRVIMAAYSDRTLSDWAVVLIPDWQEIKPVYLSKKRPSGSHYTKGSPRCVWPLRNTDIKTVDMHPTNPLWRWSPNAIGGQSGSGVYSDENNFQFGLLTWSWGGKGAGQMTSAIYKQARNRNTEAAPRPDDLEDLPHGTYDDNFDLDDPWDTDPIVENGFYVEAGIVDLPIWAEDQPDDVPPQDPDEPDDDSGKTRDQLAEYFRELGELAEKYQKVFEQGVVIRPPEPDPDTGNCYGL
jgi:hypothetical protein